MSVVSSVYGILWCFWQFMLVKRCEAPPMHQLIIGSLLALLYVGRQDNNLKGQSGRIVATDCCKADRNSYIFIGIES
uniref:Uncharacterized protein n=1 Tax=Romanomermis culicivorax TaxID=13658 RepID=A0A915L8V6_ROMCU